MTLAQEWLAAFCLALSATVVAADDDVQRVGKLGHISRLEIQGAKTYSAVTRPANY